MHIAGFQSDETLYSLFGLTTNEQRQPKSFSNKKARMQEVKGSKDSLTKRTGNERH